MFRFSCLIVGQFSAIFMSICLYINQGKAQSFVDFTSIIDQQPSQVTSTTSQIPTPFQESYFEYLQNRFSNQKLSDVLFLERPAISGPRLMVADINRISTSVQNILQTVPDVQSRMKKSFSFHSFKFDHKPFYIAQAEIDHYYSLYPRILSLRTSYGGQFNEERINVALSNWLKEKNSIERSRELADVLIISAIPEAAFDKFKEISSTVLLLHWNYILKSAFNLGSRLKLPNKILDSLLQQSSFSDFNSKELLKGLVAMPMTVEEAIFKGIGPGECVRTSVFRYVDSFFEDTKVIKILKDGVEIGYITIYETRNKGGQNVWLIETIQGPILSFTKNKLGVVNNLLATLQALSAQSKALLAVPGKSMNTFNFKEIASSIIGTSEYASGINTEVDYKNKSGMDSLNKIALAGHSGIDQSILDLSGYNKSSVVNAMTINGGSVRVLSPNHALDSNSLEKYMGLFSEIQGTAKHVTSESNNPLVRKASILATGSDFGTKKVIYEIYENLKAIGDTANAELVQSFLYSQLPKELWNSSFSDKFNYLKHRVNNVAQKESIATALKAEVLLSAQTWNEFIAVSKLGDKGETFPTLLLQALNHFSKFNSENSWIEVYSDFLKLTKTPTEDFLLSRIVVDRIQSSDDFLKFSMIASGKSGSMKWDDARARSAFLAEESRRFTNFSTSEDRFDFFDNLLKILQEQADLQVRSDLADTFTRLDELAKLSVIGHHKSSGFSGNGLKVYQKIVLGTFSRIIENMTTEEILKQIDIFPIIVKNFESDARIEFCRLLASKYQTVSQLDSILNSVDVSRSAIFRSDFFSEIKSDLRINFIRNDPTAITEYVSKLRLGTPDAIFASGGASLSKDAKNTGVLGRIKILWKMRSFKNVLHPDDATSLLKLISNLVGHPDLLDRLIFSLSKLERTFQLNIDIPEHKALLQKLDLISKDLKPDIFRVLNNIFEKRLQNKYQHQPIDPLLSTTKNSSKLRCSEFYDR